MKNGKCEKCHLIVIGGNIGMFKHLEMCQGISGTPPDIDNIEELKRIHDYQVLLFECNESERKAIYICPQCYHWRIVKYPSSVHKCLECDSVLQNSYNFMKSNTLLLRVI